MGTTYLLNGKDLDVSDLLKLSSVKEKVETDAACMAAVKRARKFVDHAVKNRIPVYGLTTGLGAKVTEMLDADQIADFSYQTIRGRTHSIGEPLDRDIVRAAMIVRLNTLLIGASGVSPEVCDHLKDMINADLIPVIGDIGSIGAGDLCWGAGMAAAMIGEGELFDRNGDKINSREGFSLAGMTPLKLKAKDGLVLTNHSSFSSALCAFALSKSMKWLDMVQRVSALTMQAMGANLSPLDEFVTSVSPHRATNRAAAALRELLRGSVLFDPAAAVKVQDPLSIRNIPQVHGSLAAAIDFALPAVDTALNSSSDNPVVDVDNARMISTGNYYTPQLTLAMETLSRATDYVVTAQLARMSKLLSNRFSGLPQFLAKPNANSNGFAPLMKVAEALVGRVKKQLSPVSVWPSSNADGAEDIQAHTPLAAQTQHNALMDCEKLCAIELLTACQALELGGNVGETPAKLKSLFSLVRSVSPFLDDDRSLTKDIDNVTELLRSEADRCQSAVCGLQSFI